MIQLCKSTSKDCTSFFLFFLLDDAIY